MNPAFGTVPVIFKDHQQHEFSFNDGPFTKVLYDSDDIFITWDENDCAEILIDEKRLDMYASVQHIFYSKGEFKQVDLSKR